MTLHIIRTDMLLWALEGFAEPSVDAALGLSIDTITKIRGLAALPKYAHFGDRARLAKILGVKNTATLSAILSRTRRGIEPAYWGPR